MIKIKDISVYKPEFESGPVLSTYVNLGRSQPCLCISFLTGKQDTKNNYFLGS